jgi:UDPglucose 6-dehydrogenase
MEKATPYLPSVTMCRDPYGAAEGADALLLLTEWDEFGTLDLTGVAAVMNIPLLVDGRNAINPAVARSAGLHYAAVGRDGSPFYYLATPGGTRPGPENTTSQEACGG